MGHESGPFYLQAYPHCGFNCSILAYYETYLSRTAFAAFFDSL
jgi:hypothetical protein